MKKTKMEKGITLIALIITIVVLLILAVVAINSIINEGIISKAESGANKYNQSVKNEQDMLSGYEEYLDKITGKKVAEVQNKVISDNQNTTVYDAYGNKIVVPAGFKIVVDSTTNNADTVTKGIVIEDCTGTATNGSQFVWIPVGKIYTDTERTEANAKTITLGRYESFEATDGVYTPAQKAEDYATSTKISFSNTDYTEDTASSYENAVARNLEAFVTSATTKGGYYIGRYEARTDNTTGRTSSSDALTAVTTIKANAVYNYVTQAQASSLAQRMYEDGYKTDGTGTFSSDLINSYAWDTAIVFLQEFDDRANPQRPYSKQTSLSGSFQNTGTTWDVICNIYDMAGNCFELSTEGAYVTYLDEHKVVYRGCAYVEGIIRVGDRSSVTNGNSDQYTAFRPLLYVGL